MLQYFRVLTIYIRTYIVYMDVRPVQGNALTLGTHVLHTYSVHVSCIQITHEYCMYVAV